MRWLWGGDRATVKGETQSPTLNLDTLSKEQRKVLYQFYLCWKNAEITAVEFMSKLNLKKNSFYKIVNEYEEQKDAS
ncbi:hypothetical protein CBW65_18560 [Tumebacillus avium]|uniref:Uncharacterized protein n=1 Tax=Tumebacillus avium TaxID=1903704 RepID=A0A1Y0ITD3_9BACL|nr:hypothetical protein CBW65_18560 [Tumebacillus avium]